MIALENIELRAMEPTDIEILYHWENDARLWHLSNTIIPFSKFVLEQYILNSQNDLFADKQLRLIIDLKNGTKRESIGAIDLFDFDPLNKKAGIGILIDERQQGHGFAQLALKLLIEYSFNTLLLHQLYCNITIDNEKSLNLFGSLGFEITGTKKDWILKNKKWTDEYILQLINK